MTRGKPIRRVIFNVYELDDWLLKALVGKRKKGRYAGEAEAIRRALKLQAAMLDLTPPTELLAREKSCDQ